MEPASGGAGGAGGAGDGGDGGGAAGGCSSDKDAKKLEKVYNWIADWYVSNGAPHTKESCDPHSCGAGIEIPIQVWEHKETKQRALAWKRVHPEWSKGDYVILPERVRGIYVCKNGHTHLCAGDRCNSVPVDNHNGNKVCPLSGRVVRVISQYDWREKKKGAFAPRKTKMTDPGATRLMMLNGSNAEHEGGPLARRAVQLHNTVDLKLIQLAQRCIVDCLFSQLRQELFFNSRRGKYRQIVNKAQQYIKKCRRQNVTAHVAYINNIAISCGWFSNCTYETVMQAQDPRAVVMNLCPLVVSYYKVINGLNPQQVYFKSFLTFAVSLLYSTTRGVNMYGVQVIPKFAHISFLLPHPSACESFMKCLWSLYEDNSSPTQQNFLTKTMNNIRNTLNKHLTDATKASAFANHCDSGTVALRNHYSGIMGVDL